MFDPAGLQALTEAERDRYRARTPGSASHSVAARRNLLNGVPMAWMGEWHLPYPLFVDHAEGAHLTDVDGNRYVDFCLGDTGAMFGHSPAPTARTLARQASRGLTTMLPSEEAAAVAAHLAERFGLPLWQFAMTATDANRSVLRLARALTGRPRVLVFNECYHGTLDETLVRLDEGRVARRSVADMCPAVPPETLTEIVEFNDLPALERALAVGDIAAVLAEPVMTNCGIVLPDPGFHAELRRLTRAHDVLLVIDETHTLSTGYGGYTGVHGLEPDVMTLGKAIAGGLPVGAYGLSTALGERIMAGLGREVSAMVGIGGTLSGNAFQMAALKATLEEVATPAAFDHMLEGGNRLADGIEAIIARLDLPWQVTRCGARAEFHFQPTPPRTGGEAVGSLDWRVVAFIHLHCCNRGFLMTPFHNMLLVSPETGFGMIDDYLGVLGDGLGALAAVRA